MSSRSAGAMRIWRARNARSRRDRAFLAYMVFMIAVVAVAPLARAVWLSATSAESVAVLASSTAPAVTVLVVAGLWAGALLLGRNRGPALRPSFLTHALATSDLPRSDTFLRPLLIAGSLVTALTTIIAGLLAGSLVSHELADPLSAASFAMVGTLVGVITTVAWLAGQALPRAALPIALGILSLGAATAAPAAHPFTPWGWVGLAYPGGSPLLLIPMIALTAALVTAAPALMNRLDSAGLVAQAARWDSSTAHATIMDFSAAATIYQTRPHLGRRIRTVRSIRWLPATFLISDAISAVRTPGRFVAGVVAIVAAGVLITLAFAPGTPGWPLGAAAGLTVFAGVGPLTDGVRHAASIASDFPLYGISDERLLANHTLFPLIVTLLVLLAVVIVCSTGTGIGPAVVGALALGPLALASRVGNALKGPLPPALLTPIPTPVGDLDPVVRMAWALDGMLLAALAGASAALAFDAPLLLAGATIVLISVGFSRWRHRG
ncbi:hypothetical protein [Agromyces laixinhei]|uniref:hypothetical protein n=1 Tax=Agromyces laixinhei TaxID=2585717 RepID=UPI001115F347|nr:hypothetical protein [Agromyces laixinhei]